MHKYNAQKTTVAGITFDSKAEAGRYTELKLLEKAGVISGLRLQPVYPLQNGFNRNGKRYRPIKYKADFEYIQDNQTVVEDVKGVETEAFKIKKKMFLVKYPDILFRIYKKGRVVDE